MKGHILLHRGDHVASAMSIKNAIWAPQHMGICLAVPAIANTAIRLLWMVYDPLHYAALTAESMFHMRLAR